jgi:hypothetical protein
MARGMSLPQIVFVDVDDALVRSAGSKRIPMSNVVERVRALRAAGATLYCWSTGGADYARSSAIELGLSDCFSAFLPKPTAPSARVDAKWRRGGHAVCASRPVSAHE